MSILFGLFILWVVVTVVGHVSFIAVRSIWRGISGEPEWARNIDQQTASNQSIEGDLDADAWTFKRIARRMRQLGLIDDHEHAAMQDAAARLRQHAPTEKTRAASDPLQRSAQDAVDNVRISPPQHVDTWGAIAPESIEEESSEPETRGPETNEKSTVGIQQGEEIILASFAEPLASARESETAIAEKKTTIVEESSEPALSKSEVIQSFLARHNIRWGELVAGLLIVVCSIGLVLSLWQSLTSTHQAVPALIFIGGNAAIFAAGLYTLQRWKLRHTSRAVLVIAMLLVPLSVLAGVIAGGRETNVMPLTDPLNVLAIVFGAAVYLYFLRKSTRALLGRKQAWWTVAVLAVPTAVLPLMPTLFRFDSSLLDLVLWPVSLCLAAVYLLTTRFDSRKQVESIQSTDSGNAGSASSVHGVRRIGFAGARNRLLHLGLGVFAFSVVVAFTVMLLWRPSVHQLIAIGIATTPLITAIGMVAALLRHQVGRATTAVTVTVTAVLSFAAAAVVFVPAMTSIDTLWQWAFAVGVTGIVASFLLRQKQMIPLMLMPIGLASVLTSTHYLGGIDWGQFAPWRLVVAGEAMIVGLAWGVGMILVSAIAKQKSLRRNAAIAGVGWTGFATSLSAFFSLFPADLLGVVSPFVVSAILGAVAVTAAVASLGRQTWIHASVISGLLFAASVFHPLDLSRLPESLSTNEILYTLLSVAFSILLVVEFLHALVLRFNRSSSTSYSRRLFQSFVGSNSISIDADAVKTWMIYASVLACVSGVIAAVTYSALNHSMTSFPRGMAWSVPSGQNVLSLAVTAIVLLWSASKLKSKVLLLLSQVASLVAAVLLAVGWYGDWLLPWRDAHLLTTLAWCWALLLCGFTAFWLLLRQMCQITIVGRNQWPPQRLCGVLKLPIASVDQSAESVTWTVAAGLMLINVICSYTSIHIGVWRDVATTADSSVWLPVASIIAVVLVTVGVAQTLDFSPGGRSCFPPISDWRGNDLWRLDSDGALPAVDQ